MDNESERKLRIMAEAADALGKAAQANTDRFTGLLYESMKKAMDQYSMPVRQRLIILAQMIVLTVGKSQDDEEFFLAVMAALSLSIDKNQVVDPGKLEA